MIECPDDLPEPIDFDAPARAADMENGAERRPYVHRAISAAELARAITAALNRSTQEKQA